jgi:hypothetical protein
VGTGYDEVTALVGPMVCSEVAQGGTRVTQAAIEVLEYLEKASIIRLLTTGLISAGFCNGSEAILAPLSALHRSFQIYCLLCMRHAEGVIPDQRLNARVNSLGSL